MTEISNAPRSVDYGIAPITAFRIAEKDDESGKVTMMEVDGRKVTPTSRFWTSICALYSTYGLTTKLFKLYDHAEVFQRLTDRLGGNGKDRLRFAIESKGDVPGTLLAVTSPSKPIINFQELPEALERYLVPTEAAKGARIAPPEYGGGIVRSTHSPAHMDDFNIGPDTFAHQYVMETPIDGFGYPLIYLSLLRYVCSNGAVGYSRAFKSEVNLGKGDDAARPLFTLQRAMDAFSNEEGYQALRHRWEAATDSWASINEAHRVLKVLQKMAQFNLLHAGSSPLIDGLAYERNMKLAARTGTTNVGENQLENELQNNPVTINLMRAYTELTGDIVGVYGLTQIDAISSKKQAALPVKCSMYELLNFITEVATHYCTAKNGRLLQAEVGNFVSHEYDLEGTMAQYPTFPDFFTDINTPSAN